MNAAVAAEPAPQPAAASATAVGAVRPVPVVVATRQQPVGTRCDGPCCCTWFGGAIIQIAAFGFLSFSTLVAWVIGMAFAYVYALMMLGLAKYLERRIERDPSSVDSSIAGSGRSMLYIASMAFVFIGGMYIPINAFGSDSEDPFGTPGSGSDQDLRAALPDGSSAALQAWAAPTRCSHDDQAPEWAAFSGAIYLSAYEGDVSSADGQCEWRAPVLRVPEGSGGTASEQLVVGGTSSKLYDAWSFVEWNNALYFSAVTDDSGRELFYAATDGSISAAPEVRPGSSDGNVRALLADGDSLFFRGFASEQTESNYGYYTGGWQLSATGELTELVANPAVGSSPGEATELEPEPVPKTVLPQTDETPEVQGSDSQLWAMFFFAVVPYLGCSSALFVNSKAPGLMVNVASGGAIAVLNLVAIASNVASLEDFIKPFLATYCTIGILIAMAMKIRAILEEETAAWLLNVNALTLFVTLHLILELPWMDDAWRYVVYDIVLLAFAWVTLVSQCMAPMVCCAIGACATQCWLSHSVHLGHFVFNTIDLSELVLRCKCRTVPHWLASQLCARRLEFCVSVAICWHGAAWCW